MEGAAAPWPLLIRFVAPSSVERETPLRSHLPVVRNGPPGTFVRLPAEKLRISLPTDQIVFSAEREGAAVVAFGGMRFDGLEDGRLVFRRVRELFPEAQLSPDRSWTMRLDPRVVSSIHVNGSRAWPG